MAKAITGHIEAYVIGDDYNDYIERMDSLMGLNAIEAAAQMNFCIGFCGADLYKIIKSCIAPTKVTDITYIDMKKKLKEYFEPKLNKTAERFKFYCRQQKEDETVSDYLIEIKALSRTCEFGEYLTEALCDKVVFGTKDPRTQAALLREKDLTFDKACQTAKSFELASQHAELMNGDNTVSVFARNRLGPKVDRSERGKKKSRYAGYECYSCGLPGHTSRQCRQNSKRNYKSDGNFKRVPHKSKIHELQDECSHSENGNSDNDEKSEEGEDLGIDFLNHMAGKGPSLLEVNVNDKIVQMEIDTGACQTVFSEADKNSRLHQCDNFQRE